MTSPLPKLPENPLGELPDTPLGAPPRAPLVGSREPLQFPRGGRLRRRGRSTKAPLPSLSRSGGQQGGAKPQVVQVINQPAKAAPAPAQPAPAAKTPRTPVAQQRAHATGYLGQRAGGRVNALPPKAQQAVRVLQAQHAHHLVNVHNQAGLTALQALKNKRAKAGQGKQGPGLTPQQRAQMAANAANMRAAMNNQGPNPMANLGAQMGRPAPGAQPQTPPSSSSSSSQPTQPSQPSQGGQP